MPPMKKRKVKPLVIWRKNCVYHEGSKGTYPAPSLILLANKEGFAALAKIFAEFGKKKPKYYKGDLSDPDDHMHIDTMFGPVDPTLSDEMEMRIGLITAENKKEVFEKYSITSKPPYKGDLLTQYKEQMKQVSVQWKCVKLIENPETPKAKRKKALDTAGWISFSAVLC